MTLAVSPLFGTASAGRQLTSNRPTVEKDGGEICGALRQRARHAVVDSRGPKIRVFKKKRRKGMRRTKGHRVSTRSAIKDILLVARCSGFGLRCSR